MENYEDEEFVVFEPREDYDFAIIGVAERFGQPAVLAYDIRKILKMHRERDGMPPEEAEEWFYTNTLGGWFGDTTPVFIWTYQEEP